MIRINLYQGGQKSTHGRRPAPPPITLTPTMGRLVIFLAVVVAVLMVGGGGFLMYTRVQRAAADLQAKWQKTNFDFSRLSQVKVRYQEREKQREIYRKRVDVIDQLRSSQSESGGPVALLAMLGDTVNRTDEVWLKSMTDDGNQITLKGVALSIHGVADLIRNLQDTGYFKKVEMKSSYQQENVKDMQAFDFEISCQKQPASQPAQPQPKKS
jgi:type IV pilus assembly protein PilN